MNNYWAWAGNGRSINGLINDSKEDLFVVIVCFFEDFLLVGTLLVLTDLDVPWLVEKSLVFFASDVSVDHLALHQLELLNTAYIDIHVPAYDRIFRLLIRYSRSLS